MQNPPNYEHHLHLAGIHYNYVILPALGISEASVTTIMKALKCSANPRHNLTEMLHVLSEQTGMKLSCIKPTSKVRGLSIEPCSSTVCID